MRMKKRYFFGIILICALAALLQATLHSESKSVPKLIPRLVLFGNPEKAAPSLSPDGRKMAYLAPDENNVLNIWIRDLVNKGQDCMVTSNAKQGISNYFWQYDNEHVIYIQDRNGDEVCHLYQVNLTTKKTRDLTPFQGVKASILEYNRDFSNEILLMLNQSDPNRFDVYRMNLDDATMVLDTKNEGAHFHNGVSGWLSDSNLLVRAAQCFLPDGSTAVFVRDTKESEWKHILTSGPLENFLELVTFSKDGKSLYVITSIDANASRLLKINLETLAREVVYEDPMFDVSYAMVNPLTYEIDGVGIHRHKPDLVIFNQEILRDFAPLADTEAVVQISSEDLQRKKWILSYSYDDKPSQLFLYNRETKEKEFLFTPRPELSQYLCSKMTPISYQARDGMIIYGYLTLPPENLPKIDSAVMLVHGGPNSRDGWGCSPLVQWLANRGYVVLQVNYRGSTGYGKNYLNAGNKEWGGKMHDDLLDGKAFLVANGYAKEDKVAIFGGSYGGYATLVGLAFTPEEFCCGVDIVGPSNIVSLLRSIPSYWTPLKACEDIRVGNPDTEEEFLKSRSPLFKAHQVIRPLLIAQGANDPRVKQAESDQMVAEMRKHNKAVEYLLFEDEGHGFAIPENRLKFFAATERFLSQYLGGRCQPPSKEEDWQSVKR